MADLIIKSSTGSGNNLLIQGADSSPAITIAETGTTTFAENATLSGTANNLGTVTAGNLSNTAIVYPVGHVLQCLVGTFASAVTVTTVADIGLDVTITPRSATNKILVTVNINYQHGAAKGMQVTLIRSNGGANTTIYNTSNYHVYNSSSTQVNGRVTHSVLDDISTSPAWTSGAIIYKTYITAYYVSGLGNSVTIADGSTPCQIIAMEIVG